MGCDEFKDAFFFYHYPGPFIVTEPVPVPKPVQNRTEPNSQTNVTRVEQEPPADELDPLAKPNPLPEQTQNKTKSDASQVGPFLPLGLLATTLLVRVTFSAYSWIIQLGRPFVSYEIA